MSKIESTPSKQVSAPTPQISTKIGDRIKITMRIGNLIALAAFIIFFTGLPGAQNTTYALLILSAVISSFVIERSVSLRNRGQHKGFFKIICFSFSESNSPFICDFSNGFIIFALQIA